MNLILITPFFSQFRTIRLIFSKKESYHMKYEASKRSSEKRFDRNQSTH